MAKAAKTAIKTKDQKAAAEAKNWSKVIKTVRSPKTGAYTFKESIVHKDKIKEFLAQELTTLISFIYKQSFQNHPEALFILEHL